MAETSPPSSSTPAPPSANLTKKEKEEKKKENEGKDEEHPQDLRSPDVTTKYRVASTIANQALEKIINIINNNKIDEEDYKQYVLAHKENEKKEEETDTKKEKEKEKEKEEEKKNVSSSETSINKGLDISTLCDIADNLISQETAKVYNKKEKGEKVEKGIAFPTCISPNEICAHFSPLPNESRSLKKGDVVKIALGTHIDGYICVAGHTMIVKGGEEKEEEKGKSEEEKEKEERRKGDVIKAAWYAGEAALRCIKVGNKNSYVSSVINKCIKQFNCNHVMGFYSHQMKRYVIDGNQRIANSDSLEEKAEEFTFDTNEVYGVDIVVSTGEGKARESGMRTMVFKRAVETNYTLKTHLSRVFVHAVNKNHPTLPFSVRGMDERAWRVGVTECMRHELLHPYIVLSEKPGEYVAQIKFTVLLLPGGTKKISGFPFDVSAIKSNHEIEDEQLKKILATSAHPKKKKKSSPSKGAMGANADEGESADSKNE